MLLRARTLNRTAFALVFLVACSGEQATEDYSDLDQAATVCGGGSTVKGIDVSYYQGTIDWNRVAADGVRYAFIRVSDGTGYIDPKFPTYWAQSRAAGIVHGAYQYFRPNQDPIAQANLFLSKVGTQMPDDLPPVEGDAAQLRQVVMNLVTNAAEAIEERPGTIIVRTGLMRAEPGFFRTTVLREDLPAGGYAYLEVEDTGPGMTPETQARIFEPFFTTKFSGRGLGLAALLGIVRSHRGAVRVTSEPGRGTTIRIVLPTR